MNNVKLLAETARLGASNPGIDALTRGDAAQAAAYFEQSLRRNPADAGAWLNLGNARLLSGQPAEAIQCLTRSLEFEPASAEARHNLGLACLMLDRLDDALLCFTEALHFRPAYAEAAEARGFVFERLGKWKEAAESYRIALESEPSALHSLLGLAGALVEDKKFDEAGIMLERARRIAPGAEGVLLRTGLWHQRQRRWIEAERMFRMAIEADPARPAGWSNLASSLAMQGRGEQAAQAALEALKRDSLYVPAHANFALGLKLQGNPVDAAACYERALQIAPEDAQIHWNYAVTLLELGRWDEGWKEWEWRYNANITPARNYPDAPRWDGTPLDGKTILVWSEQGLGDTVQFLRYLPVVQASGARIILEVPGRLLPLADASHLVRQSNAEVIGWGEDVAGFDCHIPLMSLPGLVQAKPDNIPSANGVLTVPDSRRERWQPVLEQLPGLRVGLAWQGSQNHYQNHFRSIPLSLLRGLSQIPGISWVSLLPADDASEFSGLRCFEDHNTDILDAAAMIEQLDLVISVDTLAAHLAGSVNTPVLLMLARMADWRWFTEGDATPWYPNTHLIRQQAQGNWANVIDEVREALIDAVRKGRRRQPN